MICDGKQAPVGEATRTQLLCLVVSGGRLRVDVDALRVGDLSELIGRAGCAGLDRHLTDVCLLFAAH